MTESSQSTPAVLGDEIFAMESNSSFSYHFVDRSGKLIPNSLGYRVIKYVKPACFKMGRVIIIHSDVTPLLAEYSREELVDLLAQNDDPWVPYIPKPQKKSYAE